MIFTILIILVASVIKALVFITILVNIVFKLTIQVGIFIFYLHLFVAAFL